jgi:hypothetical protein
LIVQLQVRGALHHWRRGCVEAFESEFEILIQER